MLGQNRRPKVFRLPCSRFKIPATLYECAHNFRFSHFTLDPANEKSPYADAFPGMVGEEATIVNEREVEVDFDFPNTMYTHALPSKTGSAPDCMRPRQSHYA